MDPKKGTPMPRTKCQNHGCRNRARFFVGGSAGWVGHHCGKCARGVVSNMLVQVESGHGIVILPFVEEARAEMMRMIPNG